MWRSLTATGALSTDFLEFPIKYRGGVWVLGGFVFVFVFFSFIFPRMMEFRERGEIILCPTCK